MYDNRLEDSTRLYYQEMSVEGALKKELSEVTTISVGIGYAFDRRLYEAHSVYEPRENKMELDSDLYGRMRVEFNL
jgi:hypothetical protein